MIAEQFVGKRVKCKFCGEAFALEVLPPSPPAPPAPVEILDLPEADAGEIFEQRTIGPGVPPPVLPNWGEGVFEQQTIGPGGMSPPPPMETGDEVFAQQTFVPGAAPPSSPMGGHPGFGQTPLRYDPPAADPVAAIPSLPSPNHWGDQYATGQGFSANPLPAPTPQQPSRHPPPLPPKPPAPLNIRIWPLVISIISLAVTAGSLAGIFIIRNPTEQKAQAGSASLGRHACIAIESSGVRLLVVDLHKTETSYDFSFATEPANREVPLRPQKGAKELAPDKLDEAMKAVTSFVQKCKDQHEVPAENLVVACNSGVVSEFKNNPTALEAVKQNLSNRVREAGGGELIHVTPDVEARFGTLGCIPPSDRFDAILLDIGGSTVKCGYHDKDGSFTPVPLPFGTNVYEDIVTAVFKQQKRPFPIVAESLRFEKLNTPLIQAKKDRPPLVNRKKYHILGGASWAASVITHPTELSKTRITLTAEDIRRFNDLVSAPGQTMDGVRKAVLDPLPTGPTHEKAAEEFGRVSDRFPLTRLISAAKILRACSEECEFQGKQVQFFTHGLHAWLLGCLLAKTGLER